jgi:hypothetical protein
MADIWTEHVYRIGHDDGDGWWEVDNERAIGAGEGVRITYRENGREIHESDFLDIVGSPELLREFAQALLAKADEQEARNG